MSTQEEDKKPNPGSHINIKIRGQNGSEVFYKIKRSIQIKKLMNVYCDHLSLEFNNTAFVFDGRHLCVQKTPDEIGIEDGDEIYQILALVYGGARCLFHTNEG